MPKQKVSTKFIVKKALLVFRTKGYNHTSMSDIAKACGLLKGSLYHHFSSKEELMKAVIEYMHDYFKNDVFSVAYKTELSGQQKLTYLAQIAEKQYFASKSGCLFGNLALETAGTLPHLLELVKAFFMDWTNALSSIFKEKFDASTAQKIAQDTVAEIEGSVMMMRIFDDRDYLKRTHQRMIEKFTSK